MSVYGDFIRAPGYPDILVEVHGDREPMFVVHIGLHDDLARAGVATPEMLAPIERKDRHRSRTDAAGDRYWIDRYFVSRDGEPVRSFRIRRPTVPTERALQFIGVREALAKVRKRQGSRRESEPLPATSVLPFVAPVKSARLRLVVDNTRDDTHPDLMREVRHDQS